MYLRFLMTLVMIVTSTSAAVADLNKSTAYFYDRYGSDVQRQNLNALKYYHPLLQLKMGTVKNQFSRRTYKTGKMTITVVYSLPSLKAVLVEYQLPHDWTPEQIAAALSVYSDIWKMEINPRISKIVGDIYLKNNTYTTDTGLVAQLTLGRKLTVFSQEILGSLLADIKAQEAAKMKVPKF